MIFHLPHIKAPPHTAFIILAIILYIEMQPAPYKIPLEPTIRQSRPSDTAGAKPGVSSLLRNDSKDFHNIDYEHDFGLSHSKKVIEADFPIEGADVDSVDIRWKLSPVSYGSDNLPWAAALGIPRGMRTNVYPEDEGKIIPKTIDSWIQEAKLTASDGTSRDAFGSAIAISSDTIVVGAALDNGEQGSAYVFIRPEGGWMTMKETAKLTASDGAALDWFGYDVAIEENIIVIGAPGGPTGPSTIPGSAYVFVKPQSGWVDSTETAKLTASDGAINDRFGFSVDISGETVVIGAFFDDVDGNNDQGSAYLFVKPEGGWVDTTQTAKLTASDGAMEDRFGYSVGINGDTTLAGAIGDTIMGNDFQGSAYVFIKPSGGWVDSIQTAKLTASDGSANDKLGSSVAVNEDTVVIGAYDDAFGTSQQRGSAYVFVKPAGGWEDTTQTAKLTASDGSAVDFFGWSVDVSEDNIVIGSVFDDIDTIEDQGSVYLYAKPVEGWSNMTETIKLTASDGAEGDALGWSVAIDRDTLAAGAYTDSIGANNQQGSAYVFGVDMNFRSYLPLVVKSNEMSN